MELKAANGRNCAITIKKEGSGSKEAKWKSGSEGTLEDAATGADNRHCSHLWDNPRSPSQRGSMVSRLRDQELHGRHYRIRVECEACVNTCPRGPARRSGSGQPPCGGVS